MDSQEVQFAVQDYYLRFQEILVNGETLWEKIKLDKKRIVWINPNNGFSIAALKDLDFEIDLPDSRPTFKENLDSFRKLWMSLDYDIE